MPFPGVEVPGIAPFRAQAVIFTDGKFCRQEEGDMRLEGALYSSSAGLNAHGQAISVVGDNVSNMNTTAYKRSRTEFSDLLAAPDAGREPSDKVSGSGVALTGVRTIQETGMIESTGRPLDVGIEGTGFFVVGDAAAKSYNYTRAGNFQMRSDGVLATADGAAVLGRKPGSAPDALEEINLLNLQLSGQATSAVTLYGNLDATSAAGTAPAAPATFSDLNKASSNISVFEIYDSQGASHTITLSSTKTAASNWTVQAYIDGGEVNGGTAGTPQLLGTTTLTFGPDGTLPAGSAAAITLNSVTYTTGATGAAAKIDLSKMTQVASLSQLTGVTKDGLSAGQVQSYEIQKNGDVTAIMDNGTRVVLGSIQLATFTNLDGLDRIGDSLYTAGANVGTQLIGAPGSGPFGAVAGASLERSTVDMAKEFVDLVLYQRGYQANSQVLNVTTSMIKDTINIMR